MLKTRDVFVDERLNTLTMRDTGDAIRMAEKLLQSQDQSNPEVVLEVEVMEVATQRILDLGLQWPNTFGVVNSDGSAVTLLDQLKGIDSSRISISPSPQAKINAQDNDINTLASPVIRVSNREQARIHIGQRVPIISATSVPSTQGPVITESVTYLDVGLKLEVQPTVHLNNEVAIKIALEVSNATPLEPTRQGTIPVQVDTRNAQTTLRLHDGETQILAGLMRNDHGATGNKIPGLGDIPGLWVACSAVTRTPSANPNWCCRSPRGWCATCRTRARRTWNSPPAPKPACTSRRRIVSWNRRSSLSASIRPVASTNVEVSVGKP